MSKHPHYFPYNKDKTMKRAKPMLMLLLALMLTLAPSTFAQTQAFCLDLEGEDCELYLELQDTYQLPESASMETTITFEADDMDAITVGLSGAYVTDMDAVGEAMRAFGEIALLDLSLGDVVTWVEGVVKAWDAELYLDLSGIPGAEMLTGGETIDLYFVDGVAYINAPILALLSGDMELEGVYGIDLFEVIDLLLGNVTMADLSPHDDDMGMGMMDMMDDGVMAEMLAQQFNSMAAQLQFQQSITEEDVAGFTSLARLDDVEVDGETLAVFETTVDFAALFGTPALREFIMADMERQGFGDMMDIEAFMDGFEASFAGTFVTITQQFNTTTNLMVSFDMVLDMTIDGNALGMAMGFPESEDEAPVNILMTMNFTRDSINAVESVNLPEDAVIVPLIELLGGMGDI
jgi:hypothetical protein